MKIGFVVNQTQKEIPVYTTTGLAMQASKMGHEVYYIGVGDLAYLKDEQMGAHARKGPEKQFRSNENFLDAIKKSPKELITAKELDLLMLRNAPSVDIDHRPWAQYAGVVFGRMAQRHGVVVLNDPDTLASALTETCIQYFPPSLRPDTDSTRNI